MTFHEDNQKTKERKTGAVLVRSVLGWEIAVLFGVSGVFAAKYFNLSILHSAQLTIGLINLIGGFTHALVIRWAGGKISWKQSLILSMVWALMGIGAVTPLFFTLGTSLKMTVLAFYSFAFFGAIGGVVTALVMRSLLDNAGALDLIPCALSWSFSFGFAVVVSDALVWGMQKILPVFIVLPVAFGATALIIGVGGGYSINRFLRANIGEERPPERPGIEVKDIFRLRKRTHVLVLALFLAPFYLNDFSDIYVKDWRLWLFIDYTTVKLFPLLLVIWLLYTEKIRPVEFGFTPQRWIPFVTVFLIGTLVGTFILQNGPMILRGLPGYPPIGRMPSIQNHLWKWIDLTLGLLMVGVLEELVFRSYLHTFLRQYTSNSALIVVISALAFGFIHWSGGGHKVAVTSAVGAVFMILYLSTRSIPAIMAAHFAVNFIAFANVIPKSIFRYL